MALKTEAMAETRAIIQSLCSLFNRRAFETRRCNSALFLGLPSWSSETPGFTAWFV